MQKSLFNRYFSVCAGLVVLCLLLTSTLFVFFSSRYLQQDRKNLLQKNLETATILTSNYMEKSGVVRVEDIRASYSILGAAIDATFFLTDTQGNVLLCTEGQGCTHENTPISFEVMDRVFSGKEYYEEGDLRGAFKEYRSTMAIPVTLMGSRQVGAVFASITTTTLGTFIRDMFSITMLCAIIVLFITFIAVYFITFNMVRPLRMMADATRSFAAGDFSVRIARGGYEEIDQLAASFNQMATTLGNMDSMHRNFTANVSHELKTPMTTIGGFVDGILDGTIPPERQNHYLSIVSEEIKRLSRLTKSMLTLSRIEAGDAKLNYETFECSGIMVEILLSFEEKIDHKNIEIRGLDVVDRFQVYGDKDMIHQVLYNLTENAVKFTPTNGYISFSVVNTEDSVSISIRNSGEGFDKTEMGLVFERFYKTDASRGLDTTGVGLGLNIVKQIVALHNGEVKVDSVKGEYSEFTILLPSPSKNTGKLPIRWRKDTEDSAKNQR